jgi:hypothetical protein
MHAEVFRGASEQVAFLKQQHSNGHDARGRLYWKRAAMDGAPFRGPSPPMLKEEEFEELAERVWDSKFGMFNTNQPDQLVMGRTLQWVIDASLSGWVQILHRSHQWGEDEQTGQPVMFQYVEWAEPYQELPSRYYDQPGPSGGNGAEL